MIHDDFTPATPFSDPDQWEKETPFAEFVPDTALVSPFLSYELFADHETENDLDPYDPTEGDYEEEVWWDELDDHHDELDDELDEHDDEHDGELDGDLDDELDGDLDGDLDGELDGELDDELDEHDSEWESEEDYEWGNNLQYEQEVEAEIYSEPYMQEEALSDLDLEEDELFEVISGNYWMDFKERAACIAEREWELWGKGHRHETNPAFQKTLLGYYLAARLSLPEAQERTASNLNSNYKQRRPWSAAFISYLMKEAGAGNFFHYSPLHWTYMAAAKKNETQQPANPFRLYPLSEVKPEVGDLICNSRKSSGLKFANVLNAKTKEEKFAHCDIVVGIGQHNGRNVAWVVGGNTGNNTNIFGGRGASTVGKKWRLLDKNGYLRPLNNIFAILKVRTGQNLPVPKGVHYSNCQMKEGSRLQATTLSSSNGKGQTQGVAGVTSSGGENDNISPLVKKIPSGFKVVSRGTPRRPKGLKRYGQDRLDNVLIELRNKGLIRATNDEIDLFQRIANVETLGMIQGINTWDSAVVSSGFMQLTLQHGKLQEWIALVPRKFRSYDIELEEGRKYVWRIKNRKTGKIEKKWHPAIKGEPDKNNLRWGIWAERFYRSGLDPDIIAAEVELAKKHLARHLNGMKVNFINNGRASDFDKFFQYYQASPYVRGMFQAAYNNLPGAAKNGTRHAMRHVTPTASLEAFINQYQKSLPHGYNVLKDREGAGRIIEKTKSGASF